ncbi:uncharacterized protein LOC129796071 [Lutzomyia longipalpis]|uniref:uncharacterized protein LOC129796071 n=1 Tax=Lutzomyia longipalpis TaxID=7200 RepID=UPI002483C0DD|nr:uncharacterized protein LOC129796071 [Lutzomyia longipalpis]
MLMDEAWANQVAYAKSNERKGSLRKGKEASEIHEQILQLERNKILGDANARETGESDLPNFVNDSGAFQSLQNRVQTALQGTNIPEPRLDPDHFNRNPGQLDNELGNVSPSIPDINSGALIAPETGNFQNSPSNSINDQREETTKKVQEEIQHFNRIPAKHSQQNLPVNQGLSNAQMKKPMMNEENTDPNKIPAATIRENILVKKGTVPDAQKFIVTNYSVRELELMEELRRYKERNDFLQEKNEKLENDLGYQRHQNDILLEIIRNYSVHGK